jgi:hypothetical protein
MSELQKVIHNDSLGVKPLRLTITASNTPYQLLPGDTCVIAITALADAAAIITLPSKAEAVGKIYYINAPTGATAGDISVYDKEAGSEIATYGDLDADDDWCLYFCDGINWKILKSGVA